MDSSSNSDYAKRVDTKFNAMVDIFYLLHIWLNHKYNDKLRRSFEIFQSYVLLFYFIESERILMKIWYIYQSLD